MVKLKIAFIMFVLLSASAAIADEAVKAPVAPQKTLGQLAYERIQTDKQEKAKAATDPTQISNAEKKKLAQQAATLRLQHLKENYQLLSNDMKLIKSAMGESMMAEVTRTNLGRENDVVKIFGQFMANIMAIQLDTFLPAATEDFYKNHTTEQLKTEINLWQSPTGKNLAQAQIKLVTQGGLEEIFHRISDDMNKIKAEAKATGQDRFKLWKEKGIMKSEEDLHRLKDQYVYDNLSPEDQTAVKNYLQVQNFKNLDDIMMTIYALDRNLNNFDMAKTMWNFMSGPVYQMNAEMVKQGLNPLDPKRIKNNQDNKQSN